VKGYATPSRTGFILYTNPFSNYLSILSLDNNKIINIKIIDALGKTIINKNTLGVSEKINTTSLSKGVYLIEVKFEDNKSYYEKVLKK